jgi:DnaD/phage-associated family protein
LRYARLDELAADDRLLAGLAPSPAAGEAILRDALERAVARGTLLHLAVQRGDTIEAWYMVNSANGREVVERLRAGELDLLADVAEDVQLQVERPPIFVLYEQNIGLLTPMIANELRDAEKHYPADWIADAFREAVGANKRSWRYVHAILERWRAQGKDRGRARSEIPEDAEARKRYYVPEGYEDLIEH